jgi:DNA mismatch repair ATPase MutS
VKVHLMGQDTDFDPNADDPPFAADIAQDLQLDYLWDAMGAGDAFLRTVARAAMLHPVTTLEGIRYRQEALADCTAHPEAVAELYGIAVDALNLERGIFMMPVRGRPESVLYRAVRMLNGLADQLDRLRACSATVAPQVHSSAFRELFATIDRELDDDYMRRLRLHLRELSFTDGLIMSAGVGAGGEVTGQVLRRGKDENRRLWNRAALKKPTFSFTLPERDEAGHNALTDLRDRSLGDVANAAAQSVDHVLAFFRALRAELGFYLACVNAATALHAIGTPLCTPDPGAQTSITTTGLYDPCLALRTQQAPVGNDVHLGDRRLLVITGANRGGKSTLLRALGTAQLMMQVGMFAPAAQFAAAPVGNVYTHWAREEDEGLTRGKLDEELDRMEQIVAAIRPTDLLLCNESFASTTEAEGSQIVYEVTAGLVHAGVQVRSVTHLYDFAHTVEVDRELPTVFLRAPRAESGERSYRLEPGPPLPTSYGLDLYDQLFGTAYANTD